MRDLYIHSFGAQTFAGLFGNTYIYRTNVSCELVLCIHCLSCAVELGNHVQIHLQINDSSRKLSECHACDLNFWTVV